jgi:hypothetical protein
MEAKFKALPENAESTKGMNIFFFPLRSLRLCYEKTWWAALRLAHPTALFMVWGVPQGHEMLRWDLFGKITTDDLFTGLPTLEEMHRRYIKFIPEKTDGRIGGSGGAAEILGMKGTSLNSRMKKLGMRSAMTHLHKDDLIPSSAF